MVYARRFLLFLLFLPVLLATSCGQGYSGRLNPVAINGTLDLRSWDFKADGPLDLKGDWEFYWGKLLTREDFITNKNIKISCYQGVPNPWNSVHGTCGKFPAKGFATYHLNILLKPQDKVLAFKIIEIEAAYRLFVNGQLIGSVGEVGEDEAHTRWRIQSSLYFFHSASTNVDVVIQVANFQFKDGGILGAVRFGDNSQIRKQKELKDQFEFFVFGGLLLFGLYHFVLFLIRRDERSYLYFGLLCILICLRTVSVGEYFLSANYPGIPYELLYKFDILTIFLGLTVYLLFIYDAFPDASKRLMKAIMLAPGIIYTVLTVAVPSKSINSIVPYYYIVMLITAVYVAFILIRSIVKRVEGAVLLSFGYLVLFITLINDLLYVQYLIHTTYLVPLGLFIFIFCQAFLISLRFSRVFAATENLSEELEVKVRERTRLLQQEQSKLQHQNQVMNEQIRLAREIQQQFIPNQSPSPKIAFYYKPMDQVGGDFFDFIEMPQGKIGIFLSDVSGHGVPAAFVTSMIKSYILRVAHIRENPAEFLMQLNSFLLNLTAGNFVTAFYGVYNPKTREFIYANAGHYAPYIIKKKVIERLSYSNRGRPLAVLNNEELYSSRKEYTNDSIILETGTKLFLFTDGLMEAISIHDQHSSAAEKVNDFETARFFDVMSGVQGFTSAQIINLMKERLFEFRGGNTFDDDICMICLDI